MPKRDGGDELKPLIGKLRTHWRVSQEKGGEDSELVRELIMGFLHHVIDEHEWSQVREAKRSTRLEITYFSRTRASRTSRLVNMVILMTRETAKWC